MHVIYELVDTVQTLDSARELDSALRDFHFSYMCDNDTMMTEFFRLLRIKLELRFPSVRD